MHPTKRPKGVWLIVIFYSLSVVWTLFSLWLIYSKRVALPDATADFLESPGAVTRTFTVVLFVLNIGFVAALFMMRRVARTIFATTLVVTAMSYLWSFLFTNYLSLLTTATIVSSMITLVVLGAIYLYLRVLDREGRLT